MNQINFFKYCCLLIILSTAIFLPMVYMQSFSEKYNGNSTKQNFHAIDILNLNISNSNYQNEKNTSVFKQGDIIHIFIKPINYAIKKSLDRYGNYVNSASFEIGFAFAYKNGTVLGSQDDSPIKRVIVDRNGEIIIPFDIATGIPLPIGEYHVTFNIVDRNSGNEFSIIKNITIIK